MVRKKARTKDISSYKQFLKTTRVDTLSYKTISANKETAQKEWVVVDATDQILGRLGSKVAKLLRGKYKPNFTPHVDCGDNVIIINADKVKLTGKKWTDRIYYTYTGYPGGQREHTPASIMAKPNGADKLLHRVVRVCSPRTVWAPSSSVTSTFTPAASTPTRHKAPRQLILTSINKTQ